MAEMPMMRGGGGLAEVKAPSALTLIFESNCSSFSRLYCHGPVSLHGQGKNPRGWTAFDSREELGCLEDARARDARVQPAPVLHGGVYELAPSPRSSGR